MSRSFAYKSIAIILANLLLVTSLSYSVNLHLCQGQVKDFSLFGPANACSELEVERPCHHHTECHSLDDILKQKKCCADQLWMVQAHHEFVANKCAQWSSITFSPVKPSVRHFCNHSQLTCHDDFLVYKPPRLSLDLPVLLQVFLI